MRKPKLIKVIELKTITTEGDLGKFYINKYDSDIIVINRRILSNTKKPNENVRKFGNKFLLEDSFGFKEDTFLTIAHLLQKFNNNDVCETIKVNLRIVG
jgi:hypothetical protein